MRSPWVKTCFWINAFIFLSSALSVSIWKGAKSLQMHLATRTSEEINTIVQTGSERNALPTLYLAEVLDISKDHPEHVSLFDVQRGKELLEKSPVIKSAKLITKKPNSLYIDYEIRRPVCYLADLSNQVIDEEGNVFPLRPFFPPKKIPKLYLGIKTLPLTVDERKKLTLGLEVMREFYRHALNSKTSLDQVDLIYAFHESLGKQEIVLSLTSGQQKHYLRLTPDTFAMEMANYLEIQTKLQNDYPSTCALMIDFRLSDLAFVDMYPE